jgi:hypothetical protein
MAQNVTMQAVHRTLTSAKNFISAHKSSVAEVTKGVEALAAPLLVGLAEGRLASDGSGHIHVAGVPLTLGLGGLGLLGAASGYLDEYGVHAGNMAAGLLGSYGADLGRQIGLGMRAKAGKPIVGAMLPTARLVEIQTWAKANNVVVDLSGKGLYRVGLTDQNLPSQYVTYGAGAAPAPLTAAQLEQMVQEASAAT